MIGLRAFNNYMNAVQNGIDAQFNYLDKKTGKRFLKDGGWALKRLEEIFSDRNSNIRRWLNSKPCRYLSPITGETIEVRIGNDRDAIYYFLIFVKKTQAGETIDEDFMTYLAYIITRSNVKIWEES